MIFILSISLLLTVYNGFQLAKLNSIALDRRMASIINVYLGVHLALVLIYRLWFPEQKQLNRLAPFLCVYGPLVYGFIISQRVKKIPIKLIYFHSVLPVLLWVFFLILAMFNLWHTSFDAFYRQMLKTVSVGSIFFYTALIVNKLFRNEINKSTRIFLLGTMMLLMCMALINIFFHLRYKQLYANLSGPDALSTMVYCIMFMACLLIFSYHYKYRKSLYLLGNEGAIADDVSYAKSGITSDEFDNYQQKILRLMESQKTYLDPDLSLERLAGILHMPKHHLTQVLNVKMKQNYHQYINSLRIEYACQLIRADVNALIKDVAFSSGFTSMATFNRSFKAVMNMLPGEYRSKMVAS